MEDIPMRETSAQLGPKATEHLGYEKWLGRINHKFHSSLAGGPLFRTDAEGFNEAYLAALAPEWRQHHTCTACRRFLETYGGLAVITEDGRHHSALWDETYFAPEFFKAATVALDRLVSRAKITGVFLSKQAELGRSQTGIWGHFAVWLPAEMLHRHPLLSAGQQEAERLQDFIQVERALAEFTLPMLEQALTLLDTDSLYRSEKVLGPVKWLRDLQAAAQSAPKGLRRNLIWRAVAMAPAGFCHPRSSMAGTLMEDIASGMNFEVVARRFRDKMHPLQYQRPQAAPSAGNIAQAEAIVEKLGIKASLPRRYARLEEVQTIWRPKASERATADTGGAFGHLRPKGASPAVPSIDIPPVAITWEKFARTVLPDARTIGLLIESGPRGYGALLTAVDPAAPPILQWDREDERNPVSWYVYSHGSLPAQWGLTPGEYRTVTAITLPPARWGSRPLDHHGTGIVMLLDGMRDTNTHTQGCLFPETLRSELHQVRATIEAYSRTATLAGREEASACGLIVVGNWGAVVRVNGGTRYKLDRWD